MGTAPSVYILIDENPNCAAVDGQIFQPRAALREVTHVCREKLGESVWCRVTGMDEDGRVVPARAALIEDSGEGSCYLVFGGDWGLRLQPESSTGPWELHDPAQWGEPFLIVGGDGSDLRFS